MVTMTEQPGQQQETEEFLCKWKELEDAVEMDISRLARCQDPTILLSLYH